MSTSLAASGARCMAARATAAHSGVATTTRARLSATSSLSSSARYMVDTGTGMAPIRSSAQNVTTVSGRSVATKSTRSSGRTPAAWNPAASSAARAASSA